MTVGRQSFGTREAWLAARRIGSSAAPVLLGLSLHEDASPWNVLEEIRGSRPDRKPTASQERGNRRERQVLQAWCDRTGLRARRPRHSAWFREEWASATPDAEAEGGLLVEAKTDAYRARWGEECTIERWERWCAQHVRVDYWCQVQHQLWVLDRPAADLAVLLPGDFADPFEPELRVYRILADLEAQERMAETLRAWWDRHVVRREPLPWDGSAAAGRHLAGILRDGERPATVAEVALAAAYETAREHEKAAEQAKRQVGQLLVASAGGARRLSLPSGGAVAIVTNPGRSFLDEARLLADHPELAPVLDEYRRQGAPSCHPKISGGRS